MYKCSYIQIQILDNYLKKRIYFTENLNKKENLRLSNIIQ